MPCYKPLKAWRQVYGGIEFWQAPNSYSVIKLPCGQCIGCRLERSRQWAMRCVHEAQLKPANCFITLTYNDQHLPKFGNLKVEHFQKFIKRFRKLIQPHKIRYYHCGEYGDKSQRPHYHALIFGYDFPDKLLFKDTRGVRIYTSPTLEKLWPFGFSTVGAITFESAAYTARYVMKKINGPLAPNHYAVTDKTTGEILNQNKPEYNTMSRRPGIAHDWYRKYKDDAYPSDFITIKGKKMQPPKYYDKLYEHDSPELMEKIKQCRELNAKDRRKDNTPERLKTKEICKKAQIKQLQRKL